MSRATMIQNVLSILELRDQFRAVRQTPDELLGAEKLTQLIDLDERMRVMERTFGFEELLDILTDKDKGAA